MNLLTILILAAGLAMDASAVAICKGLSTRKIKIKDAATVGIWFGGFQALMPAAGYLVGSRFSARIVAIDHWVAFILLALIGANMLKEALKKDQTEKNELCSLAPKEMLVSAVATSIDALAIGVTFAFLEVNIWTAVFVIGAVTFLMAAAGFKLGSVFGYRFKAKAEMAGGIILILLGFKILAEHLYIV